MAAHQADLRAGVVLLLVGCGRTAHTPVDLQLDVELALPAEAERVRVCVTDGVEETFGAASGHFAVTGLPVVDPEVSIDVLSSDNTLLLTVGPNVLVESYTEVGESTRSNECEAPGVPPPLGEPSHVLGIRFRDEVPGLE